MLEEQFSQVNNKLDVMLGDLKMTEDKMIDQEVRIRLLEKICDRIDSRFQHIENKMDNQFKWIIGIMITMFSGLIIAKLI